MEFEWKFANFAATIATGALATIVALETQAPTPLAVVCGTVGGLAVWLLCAGSDDKAHRRRKERGEKVLERKKAEWWTEVNEEFKLIRRYPFDNGYKPMLVRDEERRLAEQAAKPNAKIYGELAEEFNELGEDIRRAGGGDNGEQNSIHRDK